MCAARQVAAAAQQQAQAERERSLAEQQKRLANQRAVVLARPRPLPGLARTHTRTQ